MGQNSRKPPLFESLPLPRRFDKTGRANVTTPGVYSAIDFYVL